MWILLDLLQKYKHAAVFPVYCVSYMYFFNYLEKTIFTKYNVIHMRIDDFIPFCEFFVVPYLIWFFFIGAAFTYFALTDRRECLQLSVMLIIGMTLFLIVSFIYPNGQRLRPVTFARDNVFVDVVKRLYSADTPTNIFPSLHVYNTLCIQIAISTNEKLSKAKLVRYGTCALSALIVLSTLFLKQHSLLDVIAAFVMCAIAYVGVYRTEYGYDSKYKRAVAHR